MVDLMPPFLLLGVVGAAAYYGLQRMKKDAERIVQRNREAEKEVRNHAHGTLVRGDDGVYRLRKD